MCVLAHVVGRLRSRHVVVDDGDEDDDDDDDEAEKGLKFFQGANFVLSCSCTCTFRSNLRADSAGFFLDTFTSAKVNN